MCCACAVPGRRTSPFGSGAFSYSALMRSTAGSFALATTSLSPPMRSGALTGAGASLAVGVGDARAAVGRREADLPRRFSRERAAREKPEEDRGQRPLRAEHLAYRALLQLSSHRLDLFSERLDLARLRLERRHCHAGVGVEVDHVAYGVDREARLHVVDEEAELRARGVAPVVERGEAEPHQLVVQAPEVVGAEIPDVLLGSPSRDRADAAVGRVARRAHEQAVAG